MIKSYLKLAKYFIIKYKYSIFGFTCSIALYIPATSYIITSFLQKKYDDLFVGLTFSGLGTIVAEITRKDMIEDKKRYKQLSEGIKTKGFSIKHFRHIDHDLLKCIAEEKGLQEEYKNIFDKYKSSLLNSI